MASIKGGIREVKNVVVSMALIDVYMESLLVFVIASLVLALVSLPWYFAFIPFIIFLGWNMYRVIFSFSLEAVEERVPELKDALRTAADNVNEHNPVVDELFQEVLHKLKLVRTSYFVEFGQISKQIITIAIFCIAVVTVASFNVQFADLSGVFDKGALFVGYNPDELDPLQRGDEAFLYGEDESIAELGSEELSLELTQLSGDVDLRKQKEIERSEFENLYPTEVGAEVTDSYAEKIPTKYQDIVKTYFKNIPKS